MESRCPKEHVQASIASSFLAWAQRETDQGQCDAPLPGTKRRFATRRAWTPFGLVNRASIVHSEMQLSAAFFACRPTRAGNLFKEQANGLLISSITQH